MCRRLLFPLLHAEKGRLCNTIANHVPASSWVPKILGTRFARLTHSVHCLTLRWLVVIESGLIIHAVIYVSGVFQPKQIKTCSFVCKPFEILYEATENLMCTRKLFLYNLICMTHHNIFVNSVWENYKSSMGFAPTYENSTKKFFKATVPKPNYKAGLSQEKGRTGTWFNWGIVRLLCKHSWLDSYSYI